MKPDFKAYMLNEETLVIDSLPTDLSPYIAFLNRLIIKMIREHAAAIKLDVKAKRCIMIFEDNPELVLPLPDSLDYQRLFTRFKIFGLLSIDSDEPEQSNRLCHMIGHEKICLEVTTLQNTEQRQAVIRRCMAD